MTEIPLGKVHPNYLRSNATVHTWAFSAIAELIDNANDPDVKARELRIDHRQIQDKDCLTFTDNGNGMNHERLHNMMSLGFNDKDRFETQRHQAIGRYGNGFKSGAMRLGKDAMVFTRQKNSMSVGLLSQTYLTNIGADNVYVPIVTWNLPSHTTRADPGVIASLNAILEHSIFNTEEALLEELADIETTSGTTIIIYNLKRRLGELLELDFQSDPSDIRDPDTHLRDTNAEETGSIACEQKRHYMVSLKEYCKILYLKPRMKILIQGKKVVTLRIPRNLSRSQVDTYKPSWSPYKIPITFGFAPKRFDDYGVMLYHFNRLILAYEKIGCQKQTNDIGNDVIAVVEADTLKVKNNKQDFDRDSKYTTLMENISKKLKDYWNVKKGNAVDMEDEQTNSDDSVINELQCDNCNKWRRLCHGLKEEDRPERWYCRLNEDLRYNRCDIEEEVETEGAEEEKRRNYQKMKKNQRLQLEKTGMQPRQSLGNSPHTSQRVNESMDRPESTLEPAGQTSGPEQRPPLKNFRRKRNAIDETGTAVTTENVMNSSTAMTPPSSSRTGACSSNIPAKRKKIANVNVNQTINASGNLIPQEKGQVMTLCNFRDAETQTKEMIRMCNKECMKMDEELQMQIDREKKRNVDTEKKLAEAVKKVDATDRKLEEANKKLEDANRRAEINEKKVAMAARQLQEAARQVTDSRNQANSSEARLRRFRGNVYTFLRENFTGDIGTEDTVEDFILAIITNGQP